MPPSVFEDREYPGLPTFPRHTTWSVPMRTVFWAAAMCMPFVACIPDIESDLAEDQLSTHDSEINGPVHTPAPVHVAVAIAGNRCSATVIDRSHALSALHCGWQPGEPLFRYATAAGTDPDLEHTVTTVAHRPGTQWSASGTQDWTDVNGDFADIVVLTFSPPLTGLFSFSAQLAWKFPDAGTPGVKVGAGRHDDESNPTRKLLAVNDTQESSDDSGGGFHTGHLRFDARDDGGPFYVNTYQILGTLTGTVNDPFHARYTSVPHFHTWILGAMGFVWQGEPIENGVYRSGYGLEIFESSGTTCKYACTRHIDCVAFNYNVSTQRCQLLGSVVGTSLNASYYSADK